MAHTSENQMFNILLADDDADERDFFEIALKELPTERNLSTVPDGARLMEYLSQHSDNLPDVLFLDIMMPKKSGIECLKEIMDDEKLKQIPIVMYSSSLEHVDICYQFGASYFLQKGFYSKLAESVGNLLAIMGKPFTHVTKDKFKFNLQGAF